MDPWTGRFFDPSTADFLAPIGLEHFFDAFALIHKRSIRVAAANALNIPIEDIQANLVVKQARVQLFRLTPIWVPEEPPAKRAKKTPESAASTQDASMASGEARVGRKAPMSLTVIAQAPIQTSAVKMVPLMLLILTNLKKPTRSLADLPWGWMKSPLTDLLLAIPMMMCRGLYWKEVWIPSKHLPMSPKRGRLRDSPSR